MKNKKRARNRPGFTLTETVTSLAVIVLTAASTYWGYMQVNQYAAAARLSTAAEMLVQNQIDLLQADGPFIPNASPAKIPAELVTGTTQTGVAVYTDPLSNDIVVGGTLTTVVSNISVSVDNEYAYQANVTLDYNYRGFGYRTVMSTIRASDQ
jgi:type II secretory pathway pseudopilin PulG